MSATTILQPERSRIAARQQDVECGRLDPRIDAQWQIAYREIETRDLRPASCRAFDSKREFVGAEPVGDGRERPWPPATLRPGNGSEIEAPASPARAWFPVFGLY